MKRFWLTIFSILLVPFAAVADFEARSAGVQSGVQLTGNDATLGESKVYIVQLRSPPAAEHHLSTSLGVAGKPRPGRRFFPPRFEKSSAAVQSHLQQLAIEQSDVLASIGANVEPIYRYQYALNGIALRMTPAEAVKVEHMPQVLRVWEDEVRPLTTNFSADFLGLFDATDGLRGARGLSGEGIVIGVIDSGIAPQHPAVQDTREADRPQLCRSDWAETSLLGRWLCGRFDRQEDVQLFEPPENWNGICQTGPQFTESDCNNKLIGARFFLEGAQATGPIDAGEIFSARDVDGHGTHTATTAAGNKVDASIFGTFLGTVEGMAPNARLAVYKACWLRPGGTRAACNTSDLANAIDMAVADGVDVISYSVGSSLFTVTAPDDIALLSAAKAGVVAVVAAGNEGPSFDTITSPAGNPAVITAGASSRDGQHSLEAMRVDAPPGIAGNYAVREASFTPALIDRGPLESQLVLVDDDSTATVDATTGTTFDACQPLINASEVSGNIAFIQRGGCDFDVKVANAESAGAIAALVFNLSGAPIVMIGDAVGIDIPALMVGAADGNLFLDEINNGEVINAVLDKGLFLTEEDTGNNMGAFSSRGPGPVADIFKPDVTAPGINILAGTTPDAVNSRSGELFAFLTGTSMSTPHVAGVAALLKEAHPDWSPAAIKSALMTTAYQEVTLSDGTTDAIPFDFGSGHIDPNRAADPGLVYDIDADEYDAFSCGVGSPDVTQARCDDLQSNGFSFEPADLNQPSISVSQMIATRTVRRRVSNVTDSSETFNADVVEPFGIDVQVSPPSLTVGAGQSAEYDVTFTFVDGPLDFYRFGSLTWTGSEHSARSVLSVRPLSLLAPGDIIEFGGSGSVSFPVDFGYTGSYQADVHGLNEPFRVDDAFVAQDPDKTFTFRSSGGVTMHLMDVPPDQLFLRFATFDALTDGDDDLDMFVFYSADGVSFFKIGESGGATSEEQVDVTLPDAGTYAVLIHGFETDNVSGGPGANYTLVAWHFGIVDDAGNMTASGPLAVSSGTTENVIVDWNGLPPGTIYLGGISHNTPDGLVALTVISVEN
ncbi:MAG: S8 family serine peptidase [Woeseiaceae bacterium]|nr:S8 family serine peptidase [Woeseiaceae bacterium]